MSLSLVHQDQLAVEGVDECPGLGDARHGLLEHVGEPRGQRTVRCVGDVDTRLVEDAQVRGPRLGGGLHLPHGHGRETLCGLDARHAVSRPLVQRFPHEVREEQAGRRGRVVVDDQRLVVKLLRLFGGQRGALCRYHDSLLRRPGRR